MQDINLKLIIAMARTYNTLFSEIEKNVQNFGLNTSEFGVLEMLFHKGEQPVQKVAEKILVTSGTITYIIDKLQKKELVIRRRCEKDKRIFYVELTPNGEKFIAEIFPQHKKFLEQLLDGTEDAFKGELVNDLITLQRTFNINKD
ncbi:MAG: transcriptional regulator, MarR family [Clostridia bacterium]|nr:transcriptional regulator, MarR family [Clostridia bacterium]